MSSTLKGRLQADLIEARKARDKARTVVLSMTLAEIRNHEIEVRRDADDAAVLQVLGRAIKQRRDAAKQMRGGGRDDLARKEDSEADLLGVYLPEPLSPGEVREIVRELLAAGATSLGALMGGLMPRIRGRFDGQEANRIAREELQA